jgi:hypothetical protein
MLAWTREKVDRNAFEQCQNAKWKANEQQYTCFLDQCVHRPPVQYVRSTRHNMWIILQAAKLLLASSTSVGVHKLVSRCFRPGSKCNIQNHQSAFSTQKNLFACVISDTKATMDPRALKMIEHCELGQMSAMYFR